MTYDSPLWASKGLVIPEVASFKEEGLVRMDEIEKGELNPGLLHEMQECWPLHHPEIDVRWSRLEQSVLWNKSSHFMQDTRVQFSLGATNFQLYFFSFSSFWDHQTFLSKTSNLRNHPSFKCSEGRVINHIKGLP